METCLTSKSCDSAYCLKSDEEECKLLLPSTNLINGLDKSELYFAKLADEMIRYSRLRNFLFDPHTFLTFSDIPYQLNDNEIIILQTLLTQDYFENLNPVPLNKYVTTNTFDTSQPYQTQRYSENIQKQKKEIACASVIENTVTKKWRQYFTKDFKEIVFQETVECGYMVISRVIENFTGEKLGIKEIKDILIKQFIVYKNKNLYDILAAQGKNKIIKEMKKGGINFDTLVNSEHYYLTNLDLWFLCDRDWETNMSYKFLFL